MYQVYFRRNERTRIILMHEGRVLALKNWISDGKWSLPGGGLHKGEPIVAGALRELQEETGLMLDGRQLRHVGRARYKAYGLRFDFHIFIARVGSDAVERQRIEIAEMEWLTESDLRADGPAPDALLALRIARESGALLQ